MVGFRLLVTELHVAYVHTGQLLHSKPHPPHEDSIHVEVYGFACGILAMLCAGVIEHPETWILVCCLRKIILTRLVKNISLSQQESAILGKK